jgi:hypothetical protein
VVDLTAVLLAGAASGDEVYLKGGGRLSGRIVSRAGAAVEVDVRAGRIAVPASIVVRVEEGLARPAGAHSCPEAGLRP